MPIGVGPNRIRARAGMGGLVAIAPRQSIRTSPAIADGLLMRWSSDITRTTAYCTQRGRATASLLRFGSDCSRDFGTPKPPSAPLRIFQSLSRRAPGSRTNRSRDGGMSVVAPRASCPVRVRRMDARPLSSTFPLREDKGAGCAAG